MPKYTDTDELIQYCTSMLVEETDDEIIQTHNTAFRHMREYIKSLPSADVATVKHGEWVDKDGNHVPFYKESIPMDSCYCSVCGEWLTASDEFYVVGNFCPNCGADMRGERTVVMCKDCKYCHETGVTSRPYLCLNPKGLIVIHADSSCRYGERKETE